MPLDAFLKKLQDTKSPEHTALLAHAKKLIEKSRNDMSPNYALWDSHDEVFRSKHKVDKEDRVSDAKGQPRKLVIPLTFAQIMTFVAFNVMTVTQNRRFFELEPTGTEDNPLREPMELILERDLRRNTWNAFLVQFFLDIGRFSLGAAEVCYHEDYRYMRVQRTKTVDSAFGEQVQTSTNTFEKIPVFIGNKVFPISPYRFFPDTNLPLTRYQEGEFCGSEDTFSMASLRSQSDALFNLDKIPKWQDEKLKERRKRARMDDMPVIRSSDGQDSTGDKGTMVKSGPVCITKLVLDINPKDFSEAHKEIESLGDEPFPLRFVLWYANDQTIVRFEEAYYLHCQFPYILAQFMPDQHQTVNEGLADVCEQIAGLVTWKWNAHVTSQKNSVESKWIVDPAGVDIKSLESRSPYIKLLKNAAQTDVRRYIQQFVTQDVTSNIMADSDGLKNLLESITGFTGQMQGQYSQGRRSATQDRVVAQGASARGKVGLASQWDTAFERLGKQLIANNRQEMEFDTFSRIMGDREWPVNPKAPPQVDPMTGMGLLDPITGMPVVTRFTVEEVYDLFHADPVTIATSEDFFVFDATNPSEKAFLAQSLQEILMELLANPQIAQVLGYGPEQIRELFNQIYLLRGVTPPSLPTPQQQGTPQGGTVPNIQALPSPEPSVSSAP